MASANQTHILLVEDEKELRKGILLNLEAEGYWTTECRNASEALQAVQNTPDAFDLGIFDIMMPGDMDGLELVRTVRRQGHNFPVIFLTARSRLEDKLSGFEAGADDYLTKPFDLPELLARVKARIRPSATRAPEKAESTTSIGRITLDLESATARSLDGDILTRFNDREARILSLLVEYRGRPVSRDLILDTVWGQGEFPTNRTIDNYIVRFRKIFEKDPHHPEHFITRHGVGYELSE